MIYIKGMRNLKIFIAGLTFPSIIIPFLLLIAWLFGKTQILAHPVVHFIPLIWGVWNLLYFKLFSGESTIQLFCFGAVLGLLIALLGVFLLNIPTLIGLGAFTYLPLIIAPIIYGIFWVYIVNPLNHLLVCSKESSL